MIKELFAAALSLSLVACIEKQPKASDPKQEVNMVETKIENDEPKLDFEYVYNKTNGKQRFSREITEEEENLFYNLRLDSFDQETQADRLRFNRKIQEPRLSSEQLMEREVKIRDLLDQCAALVGVEPSDSIYKLDALEGVYPVATIETKDDELYKRVMPSYLTGRMFKCVNYLYLNNENKEYDFTDFEYPSKNNKVSEKKKQIEKLYEQIYLEVKAAGLLRKIFTTYYPKSFLREHADQTGLTKFIQEKETQSGSKLLKHDELASEFFGSREKWIESFYQFLDQKIITLKIGG